MFVLVTMIVFVGLYLFWRTIVKGILWVLDIKKKRKDIDQESDGGGDDEAQAFKQLVTEDSSDEIYREMTIECLKDHYVRSNKEFE
jgi:ABC-type nickel/cobalt efflux system permease component RcnA